MSQRPPPLIISLCVLGLIVAACNGLAHPKTVKIAVSLPLSLEPAQSQLKAMQMALEEVNGRVDNVVVELMTLNTSAEANSISPDLEREAALQAIADPAVVAYLGPPSSNQVKESLPLLNNASIVQISQAASWPGLICRTRPRIFSSRATPTSSSRRARRWT